MLAPHPGLEDRARQCVLPEELEFYFSYDWCLNPHLTVGEAIVHLSEEIDKFSAISKGWQSDEVINNVFLLSCGLLNCVDGRLRGIALRLPRRLSTSLVGRAATRFVETVSAKPWSRRRLSLWREHWLSSLDDFLSVIVSRRTIDAKSLVESGRRLKACLQSGLPEDLQRTLVSIPSPFGHLDLALSDVWKLGDCFVRRFPERTQRILFLGLRTSGSYLAPVLRVLLKSEGYHDVELLTIEPAKGVGRFETRKLKQFASRGYWAVIVDDPPVSSHTLLAASEIVFRAGFECDCIKFLAPTHPSKPDWFKPLREESVITLLPEQWHKRELLDPKIVESRLGEYFRNFTHATVVESRRADEFTAQLQHLPSDKRNVRLKRVFEVRLVTLEGCKQTKYVLAKSVGWGWLGYRAFLIGQRLNGYVPPILGLRDGIFYTEWLPQPAIEPDNKRNMLVSASAAYIAARARNLNLPRSAAGKDFKRYNNGSRLLERAFSRAYGRFFTDQLMQSRVGGRIREQQCPIAALIDGNMDIGEWILGPQGPLKTDYEHHGLGKNAVNVTDPAYDLADAILQLALSPEEESRLVRSYIAESGDCTLERRLFMHKLFAGLWTMSLAQLQLFSSPRSRDVQREYHRRFMNAWNFLTEQTARYCGALCCPRAEPCWRAPLIVLDIDGVLDRRLFGFPCTTEAGVRALSLLNAHEFTIALNTARSASEVKDYCSAYSLAGGIAEHGSYLWDAVNQREQALISRDAGSQLAMLRQHLQGIPGVFLDERHRYSIRAFTYQARPRDGLLRNLSNSARASSVGDGALAPIPTQIVQQLLVELNLDRLSFHHTAIDTAIVSKEVDKGTGLAALRDWIFDHDIETIAVGDSERDLAMFRVASRSFAPANIGCRNLARLLGCEIAYHHDQQGLLEIARKIIHADGGRCERCHNDEKKNSHRAEDLFLSVLRAADQTWTTNLLKVLSYPAALKLFFR